MDKVSKQIISLTLNETGLVSDKIVIIKSDAEIETDLSITLLNYNGTLKEGSIYRLELECMDDKEKTKLTGRYNPKAGEVVTFDLNYNVLSHTGVYEAKFTLLEDEANNGVYKKTFGASMFNFEAIPAYEKAIVDNEGVLNKVKRQAEYNSKVIKLNGDKINSLTNKLTNDIINPKKIKELYESNTDTECFTTSEKLDIKMLRSGKGKEEEKLTIKAESTKNEAFVEFISEDASVVLGKVGNLEINDAKNLSIQATAPNANIILDVATGGDAYVMKGRAKEEIVTLGKHKGALKSGDVLMWDKVKGTWEGKHIAETQITKEEIKTLLLKNDDTNLLTDSEKIEMGVTNLRLKSIVGPNGELRAKNGLLVGSAKADEPSVKPADVLIQMTGKGLNAIFGLGNDGQNCFTIGRMTHKNNKLYIVNEREGIILGVGRGHKVTVSDGRVSKDVALVSVQHGKPAAGTTLSWNAKELAYVPKRLEDLITPEMLEKVNYAEFPAFVGKDEKGRAKFTIGNMNKKEDLVINQAKDANIVLQVKDTQEIKALFGNKEREFVFKDEIITNEKLVHKGTSKGAIVSIQSEADQAAIVEFGNKATGDFAGAVGRVDETSDDVYLKSIEGNTVILSEKKNIMLDVPAGKVKIKNATEEREVVATKIDLFATANDDKMIAIKGGDFELVAAPKATEFADTAEITAGTEETKAVNPKELKIATDKLVAAADLATTADYTAGTANKWVDAKLLKESIAAGGGSGSGGGTPANALDKVADKAANSGDADKWVDGVLLAATVKVTDDKIAPIEANVTAVVTESAKTKTDLATANTSLTAVVTESAKTKTDLATANTELTAVKDELAELKKYAVKKIAATIADITAPTKAELGKAFKDCYGTNAGTISARFIVESKTDQKTAVIEYDGSAKEYYVIAAKVAV